MTPPSPSPFTRLPRPGLEAKLREETEKGICLVTGTAGAGKSTLARALPDFFSGLHAYLLLDERLSCQGKFLSALCRVLEQAGMDLPPISLFLEKTLYTTVPVSPEESAAVFTDSVERDGRRVCLVLDDYQVVDSFDVHRVLRFFFLHRPDNLYLVILSRSEPPFPLSRLRAAGRLGDIRDGDLAFSCGETEELLNICFGDSTAVGKAGELWKITGGWAMGLRMACLAFREDSSRLSLFPTDEGSLLSGYLLEEVLDSLTRSERLYLCFLSIPPRFSLELGLFLLGKVQVKDAEESAPGDFMSRLDRGHFFVEREGAPCLYRFHAFFRQFLNHRFEKLYPGKREELCRSIGVWYGERGRYREALEYAFMGKAYEALPPLLETAAGDLSDSRILYDYDKWFAGLPPAVEERIPALVLHQARTALYRGDLEEAMRKLVRTEYLIECKGEENPRMEAQVSLMRGTVSLYGGELSRVEEESRRALELLGGRPDRLAAMALTYLALGGIHGGTMDVEEASERFAEAARTAARAGDWLMSLSAEFQGGVFSALSGREKEAFAQHRSRRERIEREKWPFFGILGNSCSEEARLGCLLGEEGNWVSLADRGLELAESSCSQSSIWWGHYCRLQVLCTLEPPETVYREFARLENFEKDHPVLPWFRKMSRAVKLEFLSDHYPEEAESLWAGEGPFSFEDISFSSSPLYLARVRFLMGQGKKEEGLALARELMGYYERMKNRSDLARLGELLSSGKGNVSGIKTRRLSSPPGGERFLVEELSPREGEVLNLLCEGKTNMQISEELFISLNTTKTHLKNINAKLGAENRTQAVRIARDLSLL